MAADVREAARGVQRIAAGTTYHGDVFEAGVEVGAGAVLQGNLHSRGEAVLGEGARVEGNVVVQGTLRMGGGAVAGHVVCERLEATGPAEIQGDLVVGAPVNGQREGLPLVLRAELGVRGSVLARVRVVLEGDRAASCVFSSADVELRPGARVKAVRAQGDVVLGEGAWADHAEAGRALRADANVTVRTACAGESLVAGAGFRFERIHSRALALGADTNAGASAPTGLAFALDGDADLGPRSRVLGVRAGGDLRLGEASRAVHVEAGGDVELGRRCEAERVVVQGDLRVGEDATVLYARAAKVALLAGSRVGAVLGLRGVELHEGAEAGSVQSGGAVVFRGEASVAHPVLVASAGGIQWDERRPPLMWGRPLGPWGVFSVGASGGLEDPHADLALATVLLSRPLLHAAREWGADVHVPRGVQP